MSVGLSEKSGLLLLGRRFQIIFDSFRNNHMRQVSLWPTLIAAGILMALPLAVTAQESALTLDDIFTSPRMTGSSPSGPAWAPGSEVLPRISQYLRDRVLYWHRWVGALQSTTLPLAFVWGAEDPIVGGNVARVHHEEAAGSTLRLLEGGGHYPMTEAPDQWLEAVVNSIPSE